MIIFYIPLVIFSTSTSNHYIYILILNNFPIVIDIYLLITFHLENYSIININTDFGFSTIINAIGFLILYILPKTI